MKLFITGLTLFIIGLITMVDFGLTGGNVEQLFIGGGVLVVGLLVILLEIHLQLKSNSQFVNKLAKMQNLQVSPDPSRVQLFFLFTNGKRDIEIKAYDRTQAYQKLKGSLRGDETLNEFYLKRPVI